MIYDLDGMLIDSSYAICMAFNRTLIARADQPGILRDIFKASVRYSTVVIFPSWAMLILLSRQIIFLLFGSDYADAPLYVSLILL